MPAAINAAVQRIKVTAREAAQRCVDSLGVAVLNSVSNSEREHLLAAQFDLSRKLTLFATTFNERLDDSLAADFRRREGSPRTTSTGGSSWQSLTLVDDREVEIQVSADRFALTLEHDCEWELRELDALMIGLLHTQHAARDAVEARNPLRPEVIGKAMVAACDAICERAPVRKVMAEHISRVLASAMAALYSTIVAEMKAAGVKAPDLSVRTVQGPGNELGQFTNTGYDTHAKSIFGNEALDTGSGILSSRAGLGAGGGGPVSRHGSSTIGQVDGEVMTLIRRLAMLGNIAVDTQVDAAHSAHSGGPRSSGSGNLQPMANLILAHREELRQAATGALDHMVIDVVGSLFDQILSDPQGAAADGAPDRAAAAAGAARRAGRLHVLLVAPPPGAPLRQPHRLAGRSPSTTSTTAPASTSSPWCASWWRRSSRATSTRSRCTTRSSTSSKPSSPSRPSATSRTTARPSTLLDKKETELRLQQRYMLQLQRGAGAGADGRLPARLPVPGLEPGADDGRHAATAPTATASSACARPGATWS